MQYTATVSETFGFGYLLPSFEELNPKGHCADPSKEIPASCGEDVYLAHEKIHDHNHSERQFLLKAIGRNVINFLRQIWKAVRIFNPFTVFFKVLDEIRCQRHVQDARCRYGAKTNEEIKKYHESLLFNELNPNESALFRIYRSANNGPKPLIVLFLGNEQDHTWSELNAGVIKVFNKFKEDGNVDVVLFRVGNYKKELMHKFLLSGDCSNHPDVIFQHSANIIEDIIKGRGMFTGSQKPSSIVFAGYSWGGGSVDRFLKEHWEKINPGIPVLATAYIDAIKLGSYDLGSPVKERPLYSFSHCSFYQNDSVFLNGSEQEKIKPRDLSMFIKSENHNCVDDNPLVIDGVYKFLKMHIDNGLPKAQIASN